MATYTYKPGLGQSAAYQVSGKPFVTGAVNPAITSRIDFPSVSSWVVVSNTDQANALRVAFSVNGLNAGHSNYYTVPANSQSPRLDLKVTAIHLGGDSTSADVMAGLTYIETGEINNSSVSPSGTNWSGSAGALVG